MIRKLFFFAAMLCGLAALADDTMTFIVGNDVCAPITVKVGGQSYKVRTSLTINRVNGAVTAIDCSGRKLKYDFSTRGSVGSSADTYTFQNAYDVNHDSGYSGYSSNSNASSSNTGHGAHTPIFSLGGGSDGEAYPSLQLALGASRAYGEFARVRYTGGGFHGYGTIGKDMWGHPECKDKLLWNIGIGSYFAFGGHDPSMDISIGLSIGQQAQWDKLSLMLDADYTAWIGRWRRIGVFAGVGLGWGAFTEMFSTDDYESTGGFAWNIEAGIIIRIANF